MMRAMIKIGSVIGGVLVFCVMSAILAGIILFYVH